MWLGEFLCQHNVISHEQLVSAMSGYYANREPIGRLALKCGMLSFSDVTKILMVQAEDPAPFGKVAVRLGLLIEEQVEILIGRQSFRESIWDYLVRKDYISQEAFEHWMIQFHKQANLEEITSAASP